MRKIITLLILVFLMLGAFASNHPGIVPAPSASHQSLTLTDPNPPRKTIQSLRIRDVQQLIGRKLTLKEKISFKILQWKMKKGKKLTLNKSKSDKGTVALVLGIAALVFLFLPFVVLLSLPAAILAIVLGNDVKKTDPDSKNAKVAVILGWVAIGLFITALVVALVVLTSSGFWF